MSKTALSQWSELATILGADRRWRSVPGPSTVVPHATVTFLKPNQSACPICAAVVPDDLRAVHSAWHIGLYAAPEAAHADD